MAATTLPLLRQHLIDPEICIRCNTCEETCTKDAISHDRRNYVVDPGRCDACGDCLPPCPTGAIDTWLDVRQAFSLEEQRTWDAIPPLPPPPIDESTGAALAAISGSIPSEVILLEQEASLAQGGRVPPPWSAAHPYVGLYSAALPAIATVTGNHRLTQPDSDVDIRHIVLDFGKTAFPYLEGQTLGVLPPGTDEHGRPHHVRLYSVASPRSGERPNHNNVALTVKRVTEDREGRPAHGVASNYLCDLERGAQVQVTGPFGTSFLMPNHPGSRLLMVCTGTGSAPMRAMTERRRRRMNLAGESGRLLLFFGARRAAELPYFGPLMKLPRDLIEVELAFSREEGRPKEYVQDRIRARAREVAAWLASEDAFVYVCGHKRMEEGVLAAFEEACRSGGLDWKTLAADMLRTGRMHIETY